MITRPGSNDVVFRAPFLLKGVDRVLPAGSYTVVTEDELIEGLSFPAYRRVSTVIMVPGPSSPGSWEMISITSADLLAAQERDDAAVPADAPDRTPS
jgi:hypothetical protein